MEADGYMAAAPARRCVAYISMAASHSRKRLPRPVAIDTKLIFDASAGRQIAGPRKQAVRASTMAIVLPPISRLLTYTGPALTSDTEITGQPIVKLRVASTHTDGNFIVYLEDVAPDGRVTYLTEGELRALQPKTVRRAAALQRPLSISELRRKRMLRR